MLKPQSLVLRLTYIFLLIVLVLTPVYSQNEASTLTVQDVEEAKRLILSDQVAFKSRIDLAKRLSILFEQIDKPEIARRLTLDFISSASSLLSSSTKVQPVPNTSSWAKIAETIHSGKYITAANSLQDAVGTQNFSTIHPSALILAMKSDDMRTAYQLFYSELLSGVRTPYADYFLSILAVREKRTAEASQLMKQADGKLSPERLNQWLSMDRAKLATVMNEFDDAENLLNDLIKKQPDDPHVLYLRLLLDFRQNKKDQAGRRLSQLIPKLQPDPYLLAQASTLAVMLNEKDAAARMLETYESKVEPNRDFYEAFALVRKAQGKSSESDAYAEKAKQLKETRVAVEQRGEQEQLLTKALASARQSSGPSTAEMEGVSPAAKAYLYLLENNPTAAVSTLQQRIKAKEANPTEYLILQTLQRRMNNLKEAKATLALLKKTFPDFQSYYVLSHLADYAVRTNDAKSAKSYYQELIKQFPKSNQAIAAAKWIKDNSFDSQSALTIPTSPLLTRYPQYGPAFALTEIINFWNESTTFSKVSAAIGVSPQHSIPFHKLIPIILEGAKLKIQPVAPTYKALSNLLQARIPIMFCLGEMFGSQQLESVTLLSGFDSERKLIYAEGVRGDDPHVLTEPELSAGIALALHPGTVKMPEDDATQSALTLGADQVRLNLDAIAISINQEAPSEEFTKRRDEISTQSGVEYAPMQMAYARWMVRGAQTEQTKKYLEAIHDNCSQIGEYCFLNAHFNYSQKNYTQAMKDIQTALEIQPQHPRWTLALARILYTQGKQAEAIKVCESLCKQYPENLTTAAYLLSLYKLTGNEEKLKQESQRLKDELNVETLPFDEKPEDTVK